VVLMSNQTELKLPKWPFILGDTVLLALAGYICAQHGKLPLDGWQVLLVVLAAGLGAVLAVVPFVLEYRACARLVESSGLVSTVAEIQNLEMIAAQINAATARWQVVQEHSANSVAAAREIAAKMSTEAGSFRDFLQKANDNEKATLRLEVEKLRRSEGEWLQVVVRLLDHTYALHRAAERSAQRTLIEQTGLFQNSCRDTARRMGLIPLVPAVNEAFDPQLHHLPESQPKPVAGAQVADVLATGFTYQGRIIRPAMVVLQSPEAANAEPEAVTAPNGASDSHKEPTLL
jgi:molecular chaperone GrpE (heat shock protein)